MDASSSSPPLRVVIVPWLAFGHMLPCLELAEQLAWRGHQVSYLSTPRNLARLPPLRPATAPHMRVDLVALPMPRVEGLPDGAESTNDIPEGKRELHWKAFDGLAGPFAEFLAAACADEATRPHWIIADMFHHWAAKSGQEHEVPCAFLLPPAAAVAAALQPSAAASMPGYEREAWPQAYSDRGASGMSSMQRMALTRDGCTFAAIRSCVEWEPDTFPHLASLVGRPVLPLGLLPPSSPDNDRAAGTAHSTVVRWLDTQPPGSVLYVALGSEVPLRVEQLHELALGLELAGTRFLWVLRNPSGAAILHDDDDSPNVLLPPCFQDRTAALGLVTTGWAPQLSILAHAAVGGFLTHCGQSSLIEGLMFGHPLVMLPILWDQGPNARQVEASDVGMRVARDDNDGSFHRHGVATAVRAVMVDGEARSRFVAGAAKMQEIVAHKELHHRYINEFVQHLRSWRS